MPESGFSDPLTGCKLEASLSASLPGDSYQFLRLGYFFARTTGTAQRLIWCSTVQFPLRTVLISDLPLPHQPFGVTRPGFAEIVQKTLAGHLPRACKRFSCHLGKKYPGCTGWEKTLAKEKHPDAKQ